MRLPPALAGRRVQASLALLAYAAFTVVLTWPVVLHLGSSVYLYPSGAPGAGDLSGSVANLRELVEGHHNPFAPGRLPDFDAPSGLPIRWALNISSFPSVILLYALALVFGATAAYGLFVMLGYVATGLAMFLLSRSLTGSAWIAFIAGWAFAFYPFATVTGEHPHFVHGWVFVVMAWRFFTLIERPTPLNGVWAGLATILTLAWTQYYFLLGGVAFAALTVAALVVRDPRHRYRERLLAQAPSVGLVAGFVVLMRHLLLSTNEDATLPPNTLPDVIASAAHVPMYLVPPAHHPLGSATVSYLDRHGWNGVEWTLYVGLTVLALAVVGVTAAALRRLRPELTRVAWASAALVVAAFLFSLPPEVDVAGSTIRTPSRLVFDVTHNFRLYTRFVIVVMLGLCLLAGLGMKALTEGRPRQLRWLVLGLCTVLIPLDLWNVPADRTFTFRTPAIYRTLRAEPPGTVAEYPVRPLGRVGDYLDIYYQGTHDKPILNGYFAGPDEQRALSLAELSNPSTAAGLATLGVRYVLVTPHRIAQGAPDPGTPGHGFRLLARDSYGSLFRVTAAPSPLVYGTTALEPPEGPPGDQHRWATNSRISLDIIAPCRMCVGTLRFTAASFARPRVLQATNGDGRTIGGPHRIETTPTTVSIPLRFARRTSVRLLVDPPPQSIQETIGAPDPRHVSIWIKQLRFTFARRVNEGR